MSRIVLLTGVTGFVGSQILKALSGHNFIFRLVVREGKENIFKKNQEIESIIITKNLFSEDENWWATAIDGVDTVIHAAWYTEPGCYLHSPKNTECLEGTLTIAKASIQANIRRFVGIGTCFEYDLNTGDDISTETPLNPLTPYAVSKVEVYKKLLNILPHHGVEFLWCRLFYLYGENEDSRRLVPYLRMQLSSGNFAELTSGKQVRDFLDVTEAARLIVNATISNMQGPINICSGVPTTVKELAEIIADEYGRRDLLKFGVRPDNPFDPDYVVGVKSEIPC